MWGVWAMWDGNGLVKFVWWAAMVVAALTFGFGMLIGWIFG